MSAGSRKRRAAGMILAAVLAAASPAMANGWHWGKKKAKGPVTESLATYLQRVNAVAATRTKPTMGSLWTPGAAWGDLSADYKAHRVGDLLTILLADQFSASSANTVQTQRAFSSQSGITELLGQVGPTSGIANLFSPNSQTTLNSKGQSDVSRSVQTTLAGQVVAVLPNGILVVQAARNIDVGNERQTILLRGLVRPGDISPGNVVTSTALANLEVEIKGKGVVSDGTRPPNLITRLLLRLLTF
jgi:flagellar L-ring protein precursor FlgH